VRTSELDYDLPRDLIATHPPPRRDEARLLVVSRRDPDLLQDHVVSDLPALLRMGDLLVFNTSRVVPARLRGVREDTGGHVEGLYLRDEGPGSWAVMLKARRFAQGMRVRLSDADGAESGVSLELLGRAPDEPGAWLVRVLDDDPTGTLSLLDRIGATPLPPYIIHARRDAHEPGDEAQDRDRYQTVYADPDQPGSVAAPTAGLHFTPDLLGRLRQAGLERADVVLHVGPGTFRPIQTPTIEKHPMHAEWCDLPPQAREAIVRARRAGGRVIPVGTTSARTIEAFAERLEREPDHVGPIQTRLMICPGYAWRWTDGLLTNFHLPRSTLMAMVAALLPGGVEQLKAIYAQAVKRRYRFYSFGDAMLILP